MVGNLFCSGFLVNLVVMNIFNNNETETFEVILNDTMKVGEGMVIDTNNVTFKYNNTDQTVLTVSSLFDIERDIKKRIGARKCKKIFFNFKSKS